MNVEVPFESGMTAKEMNEEVLRCAMRSLTQGLLKCMRDGDDVSMEESKKDGMATWKFKVVSKK